MIKLIPEFLKRWIWLFSYIAQKHAIKVKENIKIIKLIMKKIINLILSLCIKFTYFIFSSFLSLFNFTILPCDKANILIILNINFEIIVENNIWGRWYKKLNFPLSSYILFITLSLKNNRFIVIYKFNRKKKRNILSIFEL